MHRLALLVLLAVASELPAQADSPELRLARNALLVAWTDFRDARLANELCAPAPACSTARENEKSRLNDRELQMESGQMKNGFPSFTEQDLARADAILNATYQATLDALPAAPTANCPSQPALRETQRDWIRYRDTWLTFATLRWPQVTPESWLTLLTLERTSQLPLCRA